MPDGFHAANEDGANQYDSEWPIIRIEQTDDTFIAVKEIGQMLNQLIGYRE